MSPAWEVANPMPLSAAQALQQALDPDADPLVTMMITADEEQADAIEKAAAENGVVLVRLDEPPAEPRSPVYRTS